MSFRGSAGIVLVLGVSGCREDEKPVPTQPTSAEENELETVASPSAELAAPQTVSTSSSESFFAGYETRDHQVWLHSGAQHRRYTVKDKLGNVLAAGIDDAGLKRDYPDLHDMVHRSVDIDASSLIGY